MNIRWQWFAICTGLGLLALAIGLLVPAHLRGLDAGVIRSAGQGSSTLLDEDQLLAGEKKLGTAQMLLAAAQIEKIPGTAGFSANLTLLIRQFPSALFWGNDDAMQKQFAAHFQSADTNLALAGFMIRGENRETALAQLQASPNPAVKEWLQTRSINQTAIFPPSSSAAGQTFDAAIAIGGLLLAGGHLTASLQEEVYNLASQANHGGGSRPLEQVLLDFTSLGERLNWDQLTAFTAQIPSVDVLTRLADETRTAGNRLPVLFAVVQLSAQPTAVADYLKKFPDTGLTDLGDSLQYGTGGIREVARRGLRVHGSNLEASVLAHPPLNSIYDPAARLTVHQPTAALIIKWLMYLAAGFLLALALHMILPSPEYPRPVRGFHLFREILFALGFLLVAILLTEPFLAQENLKENFSLRLLPPMVGGAVPAVSSGFKTTPMNPTVILTMLVCLVLQALIYVSCLLKLAEIRRQNVPPRMKLKLLENEDHLFDAGLYLGFVGTIISLIIASSGHVKFSLMAAYSSTSFGIIFVVIFKIFHLRPARRALLLEAEAEAASYENRLAATVPATPLPR